jgi:hypothetical protein
MTPSDDVALDPGQGTSMFTSVAGAHVDLQAAKRL